MSKKVLLAGESWAATTMEVKGFNSFLSSKYETGLGWIDKAIEAAGYELTYMPSHVASTEFPYTIEGLKEYSCIILSDIGADTLLIPPETFAQSIRRPNRCNLLKEYVLDGGSLLMFGGYMTFSGIQGQGKWHDCAVQDILPVELFPYDDRSEHCQGISPSVVNPDHPVVKGIENEWPSVLGHNKSILKDGSELIVEINGDPFIAVGDFGSGKSGVISTDCAPHWAPPEFCNWEGYNIMVRNMLDYLTM